jgi:glucokinase
MGTDMKYAFGADIGGTSVKMGLVDQDGELIQKWEIPTRKERQGELILPDVADSIQSVIKERGILREQLAGVGVGVPGAVNSEGTVYRAVNLGWDIFHVPRTLEALIHIPVKAANDANVAAFGEMWKGGGKGVENMVMVTLGTGVGGGIIVNGNILTGAVGAGGEIGHLHIEDKETEICGCGNKGCLEQYASATGIVRLARRRLTKEDGPSKLREGVLSAKSVFDALKDGDEIAREVVKEFGTYLGKGLAIVASVVNPQVFVVGGGVSYAGEVLFEYIRPAYEKYAFSACRDAEFTLAKLGNDAGMYGAAALVLRP